MTDPLSDRRPDTVRIALCSPDGFLAFGFGSGLAPVAPGTAGSVAAVLPALALIKLPLPWLALFLVAAFAFGVWLCGRTGRRLGVHDHSGIVFDAFVGMWLVLVVVPASAVWWLAARGCGGAPAGVWAGVTTAASFLASLSACGGCWRVCQRARSGGWRHLRHSACSTLSSRGP